MRTRAEQNAVKSHFQAFLTAVIFELLLGLKGEDEWPRQLRRKLRQRKPAKRTAAKKAPAKKTTAKKTTAKKSTAKKSTAKKKK